MMKYIMMLFALLAYTNLSAQILSYGTGTINIDGEIVPSIDVKLDPSVSTMKDKFEDWMNDTYEVDLDGKKYLFFDKEYMTANGVVIPKISDKRIDLKVKVSEIEEGTTQLNVVASFGYNNWITPLDHLYEFMALQEIVYEFVAEYLPEYYKEEIEEEKEDLKALSERRMNLEEDLQSNKDEIAKLIEENTKLMTAMKNNQIKINRAKSELKYKNEQYEKMKKKVSNMDK